MFSLDYTKEDGPEDRPAAISPRYIALVLLLVVIGAMWFARGHVARDNERNQQMIRSERVEAARR